MEKVFLLTWFLHSSFTPTYTLFRIKRFHTDALKIHNYARFLHDSVPLSLSISLCNKANLSASNILDKMGLGEEFSTLKKSIATAAGGKQPFLQLYGENAWSKDIKDPGSYEDDIDEMSSVTLMESISDWYSGIKNYKWAEEHKADETAYFDTIQEFAQLIWNTTLKVGCGNARHSTKIVIVCCYHPMAFFGDSAHMQLHVSKRTYPKEFSVNEFNAGEAFMDTEDAPEQEKPNYDWMGSIAVQENKQIQAPLTTNEEPKP